MKRLTDYLKDNDGASLWEIYNALHVHYLIDINRILTWIDDARDNDIIYSTVDELNLLKFHLTK